MFIYADESGNTGRNIFDAANPVYRLGALLTLRDAQDAVAGVVQPVLRESGQSRLHAKDLREREVAEIAAALLDALDRLGPWRFSLQVIAKPYIATTKFVDTIFDSGENAAVPPMWYNFELFRHALCIAIDEMLTDANRRAFWEAFLADDVVGIQQCIRKAQTYLMRKVPDARMREVIREAFGFALRHPGEFTLTANSSRRGYQGHTPNMIGFCGLLREVHAFVDEHGSPPIAFFHDQQDEFRQSMRQAHQLFGPLRYDEHPRGAIPLVERAAYDLGGFSMPSSKDMVVLQAADLLVWTAQRDAADEQLRRVQRRLAEKTDDFHISRRMSEMIVAARVHQSDTTPLSDADLTRGREMLRLSEEARQARVRDMALGLG